MTIKTKTRAYGIWRGMLDRCGNPNSRAYHRYGGRGIMVCEHWRSFENFFADMGEPPAGMSIDRFPNNDGNYEPGNCRWATPLQQRRNTSVPCIHYGNKTLDQWGKELNLTGEAIRHRAARGWDFSGDKPVRVDRDVKYINFQGSRVFEIRMHEPCGWKVYSVEEGGFVFGGEDVSKRMCMEYVKGRLGGIASAARRRTRKMGA